MCGICGILAFGDGFAADEPLVQRMRDTIAHRGPDDAGSWEDRATGVALAHRRLSIIDLSSAGHQPMSNEDGTVWITFNGEVYNHVALRNELEAKGHRYRSGTDTETIVHLYEEEGPRCVERLHGMFAFGIWDGRKRELFLARDRLGVKPMYVAQLPGGLVFGSEIKALLEHPAVIPELDEESLSEYLTYAFVPPPRTMYQGIGKLAPAERMTVRADGRSTRDIYWSPFSSDVAERVAQMSEAEMCEELLELLRRSIGKRMMSDVPFGVFLSGGLDSSTNVALMSQLNEGPVRTFSTAPRGHSAYDELEYARLVARQFGTDHHEVIIDGDDMRAYLPTLLYHQDEPLADWTSIPQHYVSKLVRDSGTIVVQAGEGADELFHGYHGYADHRRIVVPFQRWVPRPLRRTIGSAAARATRRMGRGIRHGEALYDAGISRLPYWGGSLCFRGALKQEVLAGRNGHSDYARVEQLWDEADRSLPDVDLFQKMTYVELKQRLGELLLMRFDRVTMANSVEGREPFLDHELVEYAVALPPRMKHRNGEGKYVLRRAMEGILPQEIIDRRKQGFGTPMKEWLRGDFGRQAQEEVRTSSLAERGILDQARLDGLFDAHRSGRGDWSFHIWNVWSLSAWHDYWIAGRRETPAAA